MFLSGKLTKTKEEKNKSLKDLKELQKIWMTFLDEMIWTWDDAQKYLELHRERLNQIEGLRGVGRLGAKHLCPGLDRYTNEQFTRALYHLKPYPRYYVPKQHPSFPASGPYQQAKENSNLQLPQSDASRVSTHGMKGSACADFGSSCKPMAKAKQNDDNDGDGDAFSLMSWSVRTQEVKESYFDGASRVRTQDHSVKGSARADFGSSCKPMAKAKQTFTSRQHHPKQVSSSSEVKKKRARYDAQEETPAPSTLPLIESVASEFPDPVGEKIVHEVLSRQYFSSSDVKRCSISNVHSTADLEKAAMVGDATQAMAAIDVNHFLHSKVQDIDDNVASVDEVKRAQIISIENSTQLYNQAAIVHGIYEQEAANARKLAEMQMKNAEEAKEKADVSAQKMKMVMKVRQERVEAMEFLGAFALFAKTGLKSSDEVLQKVLEFPLTDDETRVLAQATLSKRHPREDRDDNSEGASRVASILEKLHLNSSQSQASTTNLPFNHIQFASRDGDNDEVSVISGNTAGNSNLMRSDNPGQTRAGTVLPRVEEATDNGEDQQEEVIVEDASDDGNEGNNNLHSSTSPSTSNRARAQNESWMEPLGNSKQT